MNSSVSLNQKLARYGLKTNSMNEHSLQQKIVQMYDLLELKTTQNLLLRKQNDDIKLQISTIQQLFITAQNSIQQSFRHQNIQKNNQPHYRQNRQQIYSNELSDENSVDSSQRLPDSCQNSFNNKSNHYYKAYCEEGSSKQLDNLQTQQKTPRNVSKTYRNSRFCSKAKDKQITERSAMQTRPQCQNQSNLNEKIQLLMKQNEIIMKRMNQIQVNFIKKTQNQQENYQLHKNYDDKSTHFSSNITSIHNIWTKKDNPKHNRGLSSNDRNHYSTSNLRSYCPSEK